MEATKRRNIKLGNEYERLFPRSEGDNKTIRRNANVSDTVAFIPKVVGETLDQTKGIAKILKGHSLYETCSNIWHFVYRHINYTKDENGYEQIRSPARTWRDRFSGVDCDCYSTFISSILTNLEIPHCLRITKYNRDYFQHIYPVVKNGAREIIIDCVTDKFDYEVPYSERKDYSMDLQYLNGFDGDGMEELGKVIAKNMAKKKPVGMKTTPKAAKKTVPAFVKKMKPKAVSKSATVTPNTTPASLPAIKNSGTTTEKKKKSSLLKKVVSKINKVNPATILLRNGLLASMKLNIKNVAKRLRWSYLTTDQAKAKGIDPAKFQKLISVRTKLENIFTTAGGKSDNLKKAILGGKGNKDKAVNGLGMLPIIEWSPYMNEYTPIDQLLGPETYFSENVEGMVGIGELGEPVTLTSIAAAAGVIAGIVGALKQIGDIFPKKTKGSEDFDESKTDAPENNVTPTTTAQTKSTTPTEERSQTSSNIAEQINSDNSSNENFDNGASEQTFSTSNNSVVKNSNFSENDIKNDSATDESENSSAITATTDGSNNSTDQSSDDQNKKESFWDKNKKWLKPVAIGAGGLTVLAIGFHLMKSNKTQNKSSPSHPLSGVPHKKGKKKNHHRKKHKHKQAVALL